MENASKSYVKEALEPLVLSTRLTFDVLPIVAGPVVKNVVIPWLGHYMRGSGFTRSLWEMIGAERDTLQHYGT